MMFLRKEPKKKVAFDEEKVLQKVICIIIRVSSSLPMKPKED